MGSGPIATVNLRDAAGNILAVSVVDSFERPVRFDAPKGPGVVVAESVDVHWAGQGSVSLLEFPPTPLYPNIGHVEILLSGLGGSPVNKPLDLSCWSDLTVVDADTGPLWG